MCECDVSVEDVSSRKSIYVSNLAFIWVVIEKNSTGKNVALWFELVISYSFRKALCGAENLMEKRITPTTVK